MWLVSAKRRMPSRNRLPICSNTAGDAIGMPRCWCRKYTTPPGVCRRCTNPDRYSRSRHDRSSTVCPSSTSLTVTEDGLVDRDRKSTRLNSSHVEISYAVFCLKKKKNWIYLSYIFKKKKNQVVT